MSGSETDRAKEAALNLLSYRSRSVFEVREGLKKKGFSEGAIDGAVARLCELNLLSDKSFAIQAAGYLAGVKGCGRFYIAARLKEKGIDEETVNHAVAEVFNGRDEKEEAIKLALKKRRGSLSSLQEQGRLGRFLYSKGYSWEIIREVLEVLEDGERDKG